MKGKRQFVISQKRMAERQENEVNEAMKNDEEECAPGLEKGHQNKQISSKVKRSGRQKE